MTMEIKFLSERMQYQHIKIIKDGATMPTEADAKSKMVELKDGVTQAPANDKISGKGSKLKAGESCNRRCHRDRRLF